MHASPITELAHISTTHRCRAHLVISDLEQNQLTTPERIKETECHRSNHCTEEAKLKTIRTKIAPGNSRHRPSPHDFCWEEVRHFLETEKDATDWSTEGHSHAGSTGSTENTTTLAYIPLQHQLQNARIFPHTLIVLVLAEEPADDIADARSDVNKGPFLACNSGSNEYDTTYLVCRRRTK